MENLFEQIDYIKEAKKLKLFCFIFIVISILTPILALTGTLKPPEESLDIWFQRSGALIVLFASLAEFFSFRMFNVFSPLKLANEPEFISKITYCRQAKILMVISAIFIGLGTFIWGYGDLFLNI